MIRPIEMILLEIFVRGARRNGARQKFLTESRSLRDLCCSETRQRAALIFFRIKNFFIFFWKTKGSGDPLTSQNWIASAPPKPSSFFTPCKKFDLFFSFWYIGAFLSFSDAQVRKKLDKIFHFLHKIIFFGKWTCRCKIFVFSGHDFPLRVDKGAIVRKRKSIKFLLIFFKIFFNFFWKFFEIFFFF